MPRRCRPRRWRCSTHVLGDFVAAREREGGKLAAVIRERVDAHRRASPREVRTLMPVIRAGQRAEAGNAAGRPRAAGSIRAGSSRNWCCGCRSSTSTRSSTASTATSSRSAACSSQREPVGRRLDFLLQEFNREANTLGSKSVDARTSQAAVELKVLIDQVREQVQNIE